MYGRGKGAKWIAIGCALLLSVGGLAEFGPVGPPSAEAGTFTLVPRDHWAYDALDELTGAVEDGGADAKGTGGDGAGTDGTGDADGAGVDAITPDDPLTRYELAIRIRELEAEAGSSAGRGAQALLDELTAEFAPELERLDDPVEPGPRTGAGRGTGSPIGDSGAAPDPAHRGDRDAGAEVGRSEANSNRLAIGLDESTLQRAYDAARGERGAFSFSPAPGDDEARFGPEAQLPALSASDVPHETLRDSLEKLSRLEADLSIGNDARLRGELAIDPDTEGDALRLRGASAGLELSLSPTTTLSTAYAIGRDDAADAEHTAKFDLEYQLTPETSVRAAYRLVNFDEERRSSEAEAEISIRF